MKCKKVLKKDISYGLSKVEVPSLCDSGNKECKQTGMYVLDTDKSEFID